MATGERHTIAIKYHDRGWPSTPRLDVDSRGVWEDKMVKRQLDQVFQSLFNLRL